MDDEKAILDELVKDASELIEPLSIVEKDGLNVVTLKGVDILSNTQGTRDDLIKYFEEIYNFIAKEAISNEIEDEQLQKDAISIIEQKHVQANTMHDYFFDLDDLEGQLLPKKGAFLMQSFKHLPDINKKLITELEEYIDTSCQNGIDCTFKTYFFPHLNIPGPCVLSPLLLRLLTVGVTMFSINTEYLQDLFEKLYDCCCSDIKNKSRLCLCCIWTNNAMAQFTAATNVATQPSKEHTTTNHTNFIKQTTFLTVPKHFSQNQLICKPINLLQSVIKIDNIEHYYMADENPFANIMIYKKNGIYNVQYNGTKNDKSLLQSAIRQKYN
jgi:hypothetical protein